MSARRRSSENGRVSNKVSASFFAKFIKAKVDKKKTQEEILFLVKSVDIDKDGVISEEDLEAFLGRLNFQEFFMQADRTRAGSMGANTSSGIKQKHVMTAKTGVTSNMPVSALFSDTSFGLYEQNQLFPTVKLQGEKMVEVIRKIKEGMKFKGLSIGEAFRKIDTKNAGLISFAAFSKHLDQITDLSQPLKEKLFGRMDTIQIGLVSFQQFKDTLT